MDDTTDPTDADVTVPSAPVLLYRDRHAVLIETFAGELAVEEWRHAPLYAPLWLERVGDGRLVIANGRRHWLYDEARGLIEASHDTSPDLVDLVERLVTEARSRRWLGQAIRC